MATWPLTLPQLPLEKVYTESPPDLVLRSAVELGPAKQRLLVTNNVRPLNVEFAMTTAEIEIFDTFFLENPAVPFTYVNPRTGDVKQVRFNGVPIYKHFGGDNYTATLKLEIVP